VVFEEQTPPTSTPPGRPPRDERGGDRRQCDAAVVMGGDGTMLGIARQLAPFNVPLIGINQGASAS
jgi:NAD+ kinase